ncbi:CZB domain-containing protein [Thioalkalivibrio sp. ALE19]|uniref:CZB domain-containing protein n=1 Tax=Thioalkalivibrio sp. ALE19 TaxID=1266909 RepID=UPI0003FD180B|nr:CZB domain-containing protein [Thioalkalivibrio sp. ALE19]
MTKADVIKRIHRARLSHKMWVSYAHGLIEGIPLDQDKVPVAPTDCKFGQWYYGEGRGLSDLASYCRIEPPHDELHATYRRIFNILFEEQTEKPTPLARLFGSTGFDDTRRLDRARELLPHLKQCSATILTHLDRLAEDIRAMDEAEVRRRLGGYPDDASADAVCEHCES